MKQIFLDLKSGNVDVADVPAPRAGKGRVVVATHVSLISAGTERMLVEFGRGGWISKARQQPDKVRATLEKMKTDGVVATLEAVRTKLDQPQALGYCNVGRVVEIGSDVTAFAAGDRVVSNGKHADAVAVPVNLCAKVPDTVSDEHASFSVLGAIALQSIRLAEPTLGESVVVMGLGLVGLLTVQLLRANGCRVLGADFDSEKLALARQFGATTVDLSAGEDPVIAARTFSRGRGVDAVIVAAATSSSEPMHQAATMCRKRGRIVLVGVTGLNLARADFYEKELSFQVSCSYGPGRYDAAYEEKGVDYPVGFVRWTLQRNLEAVLDMMAEGRIDCSSLISTRLPVERAAEAYKLLESGSGVLGIVLEYPARQDAQVDLRHSVRMRGAAVAAAQSAAVVAFIGAGNYGTRVLMPAFRSAGARLKIVASNTGLAASHAASKFGFEGASTDARAVYDDTEVNTVVVCTRHDSHAPLVVDALRAGKHVFVEKPLAISYSGLAEIQRAYDTCRPTGTAPLLMVGFNRRFAPHVVKAKQLLAGVPEPKSFVMTVNAGAVAAEHWVHDPVAGGGRIVGEACHFVDLLRFLCGSAIVGVSAAGITPVTGARRMSDNVTCTLRFADGSMGTVHYFANGHKAVPKERLEIFCAGRILQLDNFRALSVHGWPGFRGMRGWKQDKGNEQCARAFVQAITLGAASPIPFEELLEVSRATIDIVELLGS